MRAEISRRELLVCAGTTLLLAGETNTMAETAGAKVPFRYCFNTSTIRGQKLPLADVITLTAKAGYHSFEPWIDEIQHHVKAGGTLKDLHTRIKDNGLTIESAIGFAEWIVDDPERRKRGLEVAVRDMEMVAMLGGKHIAAPPAGLTDVEDRDLLKIADRYRTLCELGAKVGVAPMVEVWGFSKTLSRLGAAAMVAIESGHPNACVLADVYHLYKGGSDPKGLLLLQGRALPVLHVNDYPAEPKQDKINDSDRVYPGDGVAPLTEIFRDLKAIGFTGALSLELFNADYYKQDPLTVAKTGLAKTKAAVAKALAP